MTSSALAVTGVGMLTGAGLSAPASCAAIRCAIDDFRLTKFMDRSGHWILGSEVALKQPCRGAQRLGLMAASALYECLQGRQDIDAASTPLLACLPETARPGRPLNDDGGFMTVLQKQIGLRFHPQSATLPHGHVALAMAMLHARRLLAQDGFRHVVVLGVDSMLTAPTLAHFEARHRLLTTENSDGFIPGEAAAAFVLEAQSDARPVGLTCHGLGFALEEAHIDSELPLRADGLTGAIKAALADARWMESALAFKIVDASGSQYHFREASLAFSRIDRTKREEFDVWHPADCIGEVGAAIGSVMTVVLHAAFQKGYAKGQGVLMHLGNDDGQRAALVWSGPDRGR